MISVIPVTKAETPEATPRSPENKNTGLKTILVYRMFSASIDSCKNVRNDCKRNNTIFAGISQMDHMPNFVFGIKPPKSSFLYIGIHLL